MAFLQRLWLGMGNMGLVSAAEIQDIGALCSTAVRLGRLTCTQSRKPLGL